MKMNQYFLVWVDTFTNWVEVSPCRTEKAQDIVNILVSEIIPWFGLSRTLQSDNGLSFKVSVTQESPGLWELSII